jgi:hypothetical protein
MERRLAEAEAEAQEEPEEEELPEPELEPTVVSRRFDPAALAGLWRAFGTNVNQEPEEEFHCCVPLGAPRTPASLCLSLAAADFFTSRTF